jgi:hypothetical protein
MSGVAQFHMSFLFMYRQVAKKQLKVQGCFRTGDLLVLVLVQTLLHTVYNSFILPRDVCMRLSNVSQLPYLINPLRMLETTSCTQRNTPSDFFRISSVSMDMDSFDSLRKETFSIQK